jgi:hypothetical protein
MKISPTENTIAEPNPSKLKETTPTTKHVEILVKETLPCYFSESEFSWKTRRDF